jgi:hypothetical protein
MGGIVIDFAIVLLRLPETQWTPFNQPEHAM